MRRMRICAQVLARPGAIAVLLALSGCGGGGSAPAVSGTMAEATVHGTVTYKGTPLKGGTVRFDPSNTQRRQAKIASAPIGEDGKYKITTLQGENTVSLDLPPNVLKQDSMLAATQKEYKVPSGDSTFDIEVGQ